MILDGYIKDKYDQPVEQAVVELKNNSFETRLLPAQIQKDITDLISHPDTILSFWR